MNMLIHNLKVAVRNLMKYKLQTFISVLCIAIGIVTLSFAHSVMTKFQLPDICNEPYYDRAYQVSFVEEKPSSDVFRINNDVVRALRQNGGLRCAEQMVVPNGLRTAFHVEFHLADSTVRKGNIDAKYIEPGYANYAGFRSAITGKKIRVLKPGEAIISETLAKIFFNDKNPIGAVQIYTDGESQPMPVTIVDVYKSLSLMGHVYDNREFCYCVADGVENYGDGYYAVWINVVLKEGCTKQQLLKEISGRVKPLGLKPLLASAVSNDEINMVTTANALVHIIGALILLAAIIGFLRIQTQLFWLRRREVSLRVVNGASRMQLFSLLVTEVVIVIALSVGVAVMLGMLLQDFISTDLNEIMDDAGLIIQNLWLYSLVTGGGLLLLCCLLTWVTLLRVCKARQGLAANMRRSRSHLFRNVMLGIQITISIVFVCGTFLITDGVAQMVKSYNLPENHDLHKECLSLCPDYADQPERLIDEIKRLPDFDRMVEWSTWFESIEEVAANPEVMEKLGGGYFRCYCTTDTAALSFLGADVKWFNRDIDRTRCLLLSEKFYKQLREFGLLDKNTLTFARSSESYAMPIAGIVKNIPYDNYKRGSLIIVNSDKQWAQWVYSNYILVPKAGRGKALARSVDETIERLEPTIINKLVARFVETAIGELKLVETARTGGWILGCVSMIICIMSIFSTIALDTRARKKEVAIRKVNGAKGKHIYRMFGRVYVVLIVVALFIAVPVCVMFNQLIETIVTEAVPGATLSPVVPIILGIVVVTLLILLIVGWQIHRVMQVNPSEIIAKE